MRHQKTLVLATCLTVLSGGAVLAENLADGQVLFTYGTDQQTVRTLDLLISMSPQGEDGYTLTVERPADGASVQDDFVREGGILPWLAALNSRQFCGVDLLFVTLRYEGPETADLPGYLLDTHVYAQQGLEHIADVPVAFEDIAPVELGADLGFPYELTQPYVVSCAQPGTVQFEPNQNADSPRE
ncbi:hypothetical protein [Paracoccus sp. (in: a-proteobacteria)]|uniref:hypothetical protein n=1 Tax=Paracoccus sp. TaxID=267 RepID=UPI003A88686C